MERLEMKTQEISGWVIRVKDRFVATHLYGHDLGVPTVYVSKRVAFAAARYRGLDEFDVVAVRVRQTTSVDGFTLSMEAR